jgi:hypothetical protein
MGFLGNTVSNMISHHMSRRSYHKRAANYSSHHAYNHDHSNNRHHQFRFAKSNSFRSMNDKVHRF